MSIDQPRQDQPSSHVQGLGIIVPIDELSHLAEVDDGFSLDGNQCAFDQGLLAPKGDESGVG
jgi:hypothetical protein